jgi:hypothetical protein
MIKMKEKVDMVLAKAPPPDEGKWNNTDLNVIIK